MRSRGLIARLLSVALFLSMLLTMTLSGANSAEAKETGADLNAKILEFESKNPVFSVNVYKNTTFEELRLPETLRAIVAIPDGSKFTQLAPEADSTGEYDYYTYGYIAPENEDQLRASGGTVIYTISYFDGSTGYRVYGSIEGEDPSYFACDQDGNVTGKVIDVPVTWDRGQFDPEKYEEEQKLTPELGGNVSYDGSEIYASVTVSSMTEEEAMAEEKEKDTEEETNAPVAAPRAGTYSYQEAVAAIKQYTKTSGSKPGQNSYGTGVPGTWKDYVNSIFLNKGLNNFSFAESGVEDAWKWNGKTATENGNPATDPNSKPIVEKKNGYNVMKVYSVQQFVYAINNFPKSESIEIDIEKDLDFNGEKYCWTVPETKSSNINITIFGKGHAFYNICSYEGLEYVNTSYDSVARGAFLNIGGSNDAIVIMNLNFKNAFCANFYPSGGGLFGYTEHAKDIDGNVTEVSKVYIEDSLFYNGCEGMKAISGVEDYDNYGQRASALGALPTGRNDDESDCKIVRCGVSGSYIYGCDHIIGMVGRAWFGIQANNSYVENTMICGTGGHSSGFISCSSEGNKSDITDCYTNVDMYGSKSVGGFCNLTVGEINNCFVTGKIEGYESLYGFAVAPGSSTYDTHYLNCYSTALVGMRSEATKLAGFMAGTDAKKPVKATNCYAAGEVGNHTTILDVTQKSTTAGGFAYTKGSNVTFSNCFYDKQTTGMREWVTSDKNTQKGQTVAGITGVLTTDTDPKKAGNGLTSLLEAGENTGFTGLDASVWYYEEGLYPQLKSMQNPDASAWGSQEKANLAKANSLVSVSTVYLDTWDQGYDWNSKGVRSKEEVSYARTEEEAFKQAQKEGTFNGNHLGSEYTYDTVRGIITDFTSTKDAVFTYSLNRGTGANVALENWKTGEKTGDRGAFEIGSDTKPWNVKHSGMEWLNISRNYSGASAWRPIRLISFMNVEAGEDKILSTDETYDHRQDVELTIMDELSDNLVIGWDDSKDWSTAAIQGYPGYQAKPGEEGFGELIGKNDQVVGEVDKQYYEVETAPTTFDLSNDAWMYTEIWLVEKDGVPLTEPESVRVTGEGTNGEKLTVTEQTWMGVYPMGMNMNSGMKFEISYYWMLRDGRYRTDSKYITLVPGTYNLKEYVYNEDGTPNDTALNLGAQIKTDSPAVDADTKALKEFLEQAGGTDVLAAWKVASPEDTSVISLGLSYSLAGTNVGTDPNAPDNAPADPVIYNPEPGDSISIRVPYYGYRRVEEGSTPGDDKYDRLSIDYQPVYVEFTYTVKEADETDGSKIRYLVFDKGAVYDDNSQSWDVDLTEKGIVVDGEPFVGMKIDEMEYDIDVKLVVSQSYNLGILKRDGDTEEKLSGVAFTLFEAQNEDPLSLDDVKKLPVAEVTINNTPQTDNGGNTDNSGNLDFSGLKTNKLYYLVETQPLEDYEGYNGYISIKRDLEGVVTMRQLDDDGNIVGKEAVYNPDPDGKLEPDQIKLELAGGNTIETVIDNYVAIDIPVSAGKTIMSLLAAGIICLIAAGGLYLKRRKIRG